MLDVDLETVRLFLHVLAATVWVGGQLTLAALVPALRRADPEVPRVAARAFARVGWPAYAVLIVTGIWNVAAYDETGEQPRYGATLAVKLVFVVLSGLAALWHSRAKSRAALALGGAGAGLFALGALFFGIVLSQ